MEVDAADEGPVAVVPVEQFIRRARQSSLDDDALLQLAVSGDAPSNFAFDPTPFRDHPAALSLNAEDRVSIDVTGVMIMCHPLANPFEFVKPTCDLGGIAVSVSASCHQAAALQHLFGGSMAPDVLGASHCDRADWHVPGAPGLV